MLLQIKSTTRAEKLKSTPTSKLIETPTLANRVEFQRWLTSAISILILALCAPMLVRFNPRENHYNKFVIAIFIYILYLNSQSILKVLIEESKLPIFPGIYTVHIVFLGILLVWSSIRYYARSPEKRSSG